MAVFCTNVRRSRLMLFLVMSLVGYLTNSHMSVNVASVQYMLIPLFSTYVMYSLSCKFLTESLTKHITIMLQYYHCYGFKVGLLDYDTI
jgi:hypothetical protein